MRTSATVTFIMLTTPTTSSATTPVPIVVARFALVALVPVAVVVVTVADVAVVDVLLSSARSATVALPGTSTSVRVCVVVTTLAVAVVFGHKIKPAASSFAARS